LVQAYGVTGWLDAQNAYKKKNEKVYEDESLIHQFIWNRHPHSIKIDFGIVQVKVKYRFSRYVKLLVYLCCFRRNLSLGNFSLLIFWLLFTLYN
jgi:hypothetical protein